ncbi:hypothetical protein [uncultured Methanoregula sp.]|uniref:hypothetical protein n=1 Tax=uncultured Methanoregula sp. TaxID=1005933 RepID=UPI002AAB8351|nr:hypothetical protein [uncultured Methanoregula sp.]
MNQSIESDDDDEGANRAFPSCFVLPPAGTAGVIPATSGHYHRQFPVSSRYGSIPVRRYCGLIAG